MIRSYTKSIVKVSAIDKMNDGYMAPGRSHYPEIAINRLSRNPRFHCVLWSKAHPIAFSLTPNFFLLFFFFLALPLKYAAPETVTVNETQMRFLPGTNKRWTQFDSCIDRPFSSSADFLSVYTEKKGYNSSPYNSSLRWIQSW